MPIHDWARVDPGLFHHFHQSWICGLCNELNQVVLPSSYYALIERKVDPQKPVVVGLSDSEVYARRANRIAVRNSSDNVASVVEIVSPGNKLGPIEFGAFVEWLGSFLNEGVNLLIIDLLQGSSFDQNGIHGSIWNEIMDEPISLRPQSLTIASFLVCNHTISSHVESINVGDLLPDVALYLDASTSVPVPLEASYKRTWEKCPSQFHDMVLNPKC